MNSPVTEEKKRQGPKATKALTKYNEQVSAARSALVDYTYAGVAVRARGRRAVLELFGVITAAREGGLTWELIAGVLNEKGIELTASTVKSYYFEFKSELNQEHIAEEVRAYQEFGVEAEAENHRKQATAAIEAARNLRSSRSHPGESNLGGAAPAPVAPARSPTAKPTHTPKPQERRAPVRRAQSPQGAGERPARSPLFPPPPPDESEQSGQQEQEDLMRFPDDGKPRHISEFDAVAHQVKVPPVLHEALVLDGNDNVLWASGEVCNLMLAPRQVKLLKSARKVLASPPSNRTSETFVSLKEV